MARLPEEKLPWNIKIARAHHHLNDLEVLVGKYVSPGNVLIREIQIPEESKVEYRLIVVSPLPGEWSAIVGDVANNLRSALEVALFMKVVELARRQDFKLNKRRINFPRLAPGNVAISNLNWQGGLDNEGLRGCIQEILDDPAGAIYPSRVEGEGIFLSALYQLQEISNQDKHQGLVALSGSLEGLSLLSTEPNNSKFIPTNPSTWVESGALIGYSLYDKDSAFSHPLKAYNYGVYLELKEPKWPEGEFPIISQLQAISSVVVKAVNRMSQYGTV